MTHRTTPAFWKLFNDLPQAVRDLATRSYETLEANPRHPSLQLKNVGEYWSVRVGIHHRALGIRTDETIVWFWIGSHADYDGLLGR